MGAERGAAVGAARPGCSLEVEDEVGGDRCSALGPAVPGASSVARSEVRLPGLQ